MKRTILNLIATATLLVGWSAQAADEMAQTQPAAIPSEATAPTETTSQNTQPPEKRAKSYKRTNANQGRAHDLDLRHCLDLKTNIEIAQCAGES